MIDRSTIALRDGRARYGPLPSMDAFRVIGELLRLLDGGTLADLAGRVEVCYAPPQPSLLRVVVVEATGLSCREAERLAAVLHGLGATMMGGES